MREQREARYRHVLKASNLTPAILRRTFENFEVIPENRHGYTAARSFALGGKGLLFLGPCGTGKTHLASAVANKLFGKITMFFVVSPEFLTRVRMSYSEERSSSLLNKAKEVRLLILDDLGAEKPTSWVRETLFSLIYHRVEHDLPMLITTNYTLDELAHRLGMPIISRLVEVCRIIPVLGPNRRLQQAPAPNSGPL